MFRAEIAPDEAEDAGGLDARQGRQRSMAHFLPEQMKGFYGSLVSDPNLSRNKQSAFPALTADLADRGLSVPLQRDYVALGN